MPLRSAFIRRTFRRFAVVVTAALALSLLSVAAPAVASAASGPTLRARVSPDKRVVTVVGRGFHPRRVGRIAVRHREAGTKIKKVATNRRGTFKTTFRVRKAHRKAPPRIRAAVAKRSTVLRLSAKKLGTQPTKPTKPTKQQPTTTEPTTTEPTQTTTPTTTEPTQTTTPTTATDPVVTTDPAVAARFGVDPTYVPDATLTLGVGQLTQAALDTAGAGARIAVGPGVHRLSRPLVPRAGQQLLGHPGAVLNGSKVLTGWLRDGTHWYVDGQTQRFMVHGVCVSGYTGCRHAEDVFVDSAPLWQVMSRAELRPGTFWFDYTNSRIYLADDPTGRLVETTVAEAAVVGPGGSVRAENVVVRNLVVEKFGSPAQHAAVDPRMSPGWQIVNNDVRLNHGRGVNVHTDGAAIGNRVTANGQMGMGGTGRNLLVDGNEIAHNLTAGFSHGWEGGGTKFALTDGLVARRNWVHHNDGPGLWTDIDNINTLYEDNLVEDNESAGIFHEISYDAVIRRNTVRRNGLRDFAWGYGAGIQISASSNVEVYGNVLEGNARGITGIMQSRGSGAFGLYEVRNLHVHDNTVTMSAGGLFPAGMFQDLAIGDLTYFTAKNNRWVNNHYRLPTLGVIEQAFQSHNGYRSWKEWQSYGNDTTGTLVRF